VKLDQGVDIVTYLLKARIVDPAGTAFARERLFEHISRQWLSNRHVIATTVACAIIEELLEAVFSVRSLPRRYNEEELPIEKESWSKVPTTPKAKNDCAGDDQPQFNRSTVTRQS
jgi:hypothetical protein